MQLEQFESTAINRRIGDGSPLRESNASTARAPQRSRSTRAGEFVIVGLVLYFSFGMLASIYLDFRLAADGVVTEATVVERWENMAKSMQIVHKAGVKFRHNEQSYRIKVETPDATTPTVSIVFVPEFPWYGISAEQRPEPPRQSSAILKGLFGLIFGAAAIASIKWPRVI